MIQTSKHARLSDMLAHRQGTIIEASSMNISVIGVVRQNCSNIEEIDLRDNDVQRLDGIEQFKRLRKIDLRDCRIMDQKELLKLRKCSRLERVWLQGNPFLKKGLTQSTLALLMGLQNDVVVDSDATARSQSGKITSELEKQIMESHNQLQFLESLLCRLELHSQLANEYTMEDDGPNIHILMKMRKTMQIVNNDIIEKIENPTFENLSAYLEKQKQKIEQLTAIIHKKAEVLQGLRHMASLDRAKQEQKVKRNPLGQKNLNLIEPPITQKYPVRKPFTDSDISVSFSSGLQNSKHLEYRMAASQATQEYDTKHCYQKILDSRVIQPSKVKNDKKIKTRLIDKPHPPLNAPSIIKHHLWLHRIISSQTSSHDQKQQICTFIQKILQEQHETNQKVHSLMTQLSQARQQNGQLYKQLEQKQQQTQELQQQISNLKKYMEIEHQEVMKFNQEQQNSIQEQRERCMAAQASIQALIITQKNQQMLMIAKQVSLKRQYFHKIIIEAHKRQQSQQIIQKYRKNKNNQLKKHIFDVILREAIVNKMHSKKIQAKQSRNLETIFNIIRNQSTFQVKKTQICKTIKKKKLMILLDQIRMKKQSKILKHHQYHRQLNQAKLQLAATKTKLIFNFLKNTTKINKNIEQNKISMLSTYLRQIRLSYCLDSLKTKAMQYKQHYQANTRLLKYLEQSRLIQFYQAGLKKKYQINVTQSKIRKIHSLYVKKVCKIFKKREELEQILKIRRICSFMLRMAVREANHEQIVKSLKQKLQFQRKKQAIRTIYRDVFIEPTKMNKILDGLSRKYHNQNIKTEVTCKMVTWKLFTSKMKNFKLRQEISLMQPAMLEIKQRQSRILRLQQKWKEELQKKDQRCLLYQKKLEQMSYEVIERDIRFEKLKAVYETTLDEVKLRESEFLNIISKFQAAEEATIQAAKNKQEYQQAKKSESIKREQLEREYVAMSAGRKGKQEMTVLVSDFDTLRPNVTISQPGTTVSYSTLNSLEASY